MRVWKLLIAIAVLVVTAPLRAEAAKGVIPAEVVVRGPEIRLLEVAKVSGAGPELQAQLEAAQLGPAPRPGEALTLPRGTVLTRVRSSLPGATSIQWQIAEKVTIRRAAGRVELPEVTDALTRWIEARQAVPVERLVVDGIQVRTPILVPEGARELEFEAGAADDLLGPTSLTLVVRVDGEPAARIPVRARIDGEVRVLVTARALRRGQPVSDGDVREEVRPLSAAGSQPALNRIEVVGKLARRAIGLNQVVGLQDVEEKPLFKRGDAVLLVVRTDRLVVTCPGEALEDGRAGEVVSVVNRSTRRELRGRVLPGGEVQVDYRPMPVLQANPQP